MFIKLLFLSRARGVMTFIHRSVPFQVQNIVKDKWGRYLIIKSPLLTERLNLVNLYGPKYFHFQRSKQTQQLPCSDRFLNLPTISLLFHVISVH